MRTGKVYLVGAGAGKSDLITVRGQNILKAAEVIIHDYLVNPDILAGAKRGAEVINCSDLDLAKESRQLKINNLMIEKAKQGRKVLRLKGGDPVIFGQCSDEARALTEQKIEFEIVPGVGAASTAAAFCGMPLTDNRFASSCVFVVGNRNLKRTTSPDHLDWKSLAKVDTLVLYMAVSNLENVIKKIISTGKDKNTPVAIVKDASLITQEVIVGTLKNIGIKAKKCKLRAPAIIIVGKVVEIEKRCNWLRKNKRILFTGLSKERLFLKGTYFHLPLVKISPLKTYKRFDNYLSRMKEFDWVIFASRYGVEYFFKRLNSLGLDSRILAKTKIAAIGNSTKNRLSDFGILADLVPKIESSQGLVEEFKKQDLKNKKIFLPRSNLSDKNLKKRLEGFGVKVSTGFAYNNSLPKNLPDLDLKSFDEIYFTSPSTVRNFKRRYKNLPKKVKVKCIGKTTLKEAKRCRLLS